MKKHDWQPDVEANFGYRCANCPAHTMNCLGDNVDEPCPGAPPPDGYRQRLARLTALCPPQHHTVRL